MPHESPPSSLLPGSIVDAYLRDSGGLKQDRSTARQLEALSAYCKEYNFILRNPYKDVAKSGTTTAGRDNFLRMVADFEIPSNRPKALLIWNYARFARDVDDSQLYKAVIRKWGIIIHSLTDQIPEGRYGRVIELLIEISNEEKAAQTATDAADGLRSIVQQGAMPGIPPAGFKREPIVTINYRTGEERTNHRWVPDPEWIPRIQRAFQMKASGSTLIDIQKETHIYASQNSYRDFFQNELYIGILHFGEHTNHQYCKPMIDLPTWSTVQKVLALHADRQHVSSPASIHPRRKSAPATYLLSGIVRCGRCNSPLYGMTSKQRNGSYYLRYACTRRHRRHDCDLQPIPARALETEVIKEIVHFFENPNNLRDLIELDRQQSAQVAATNKTLSKDLQKLVNKVRRSIANINAAIKESGHSKSMLRTLSSLEQEETELETRLHSVKIETPTLAPALTPLEISTFSRSLVARLQSRDNTTRRHVLQATVHSVIIDRTEAHAFGRVNIKHNPALITAPSTRSPVGAPSHTRSISVEFKIGSRGGTKKTR